MKHYILRDRENFLRYGRDAPFSCERIMVKVESIRYMLDNYSISRRDGTGRVMSGDWDAANKLFTDSFKFRACYDRFVNKISWEKTGIYDYMLELLSETPGVDGVKDIADIVKRYNEIDEIFNLVKKNGRLSSRLELNPNNFREHGGIYVSINRCGDVIFGGGGFHRLSIAKILELEYVPAQLGIVHEDALSTWMYSVERDWSFVNDLISRFEK